MIRLIVTALSEEHMPFIERVKSGYPFWISDSPIVDGKFHVISNYAGEVPHGPPYYNIGVLCNGLKVWDGGNAIYGGEIFNHNILSAKHDKLVLVKWHSPNNPNEEIVVVVDLNTGTENHITGLDRYYYAGHFYSFDAVFYAMRGADLQCKDLVLNQNFQLFETMRPKIPDVIAWSICTHEDSILAFSKKSSDNVALFNLRSQQILEVATLPMSLSANEKIYSYLDKSSNSVIVHLHDYDLNENQNIINKRDSYFSIEY